MRISPNSNVYAANFGRALTTEEKKSYSNLIKDSKSALGIEDTTAIIFDFNVPSEQGYNIGIGTTFSESMQKFTDFLKTMAGITSIQLQPQGKITPTNKSPYSGTNYAYGEHIIDLKKLTLPEYGELLTLDDIRKADEDYSKDKQTREYKTDYDYALNVQEALLKKAYAAFLSNDKLKADFEIFKSENSDWLQKNGLFAALSKHYSTQDISKWKEKDRLLYSSKTPESSRNQRISELEKEYSDIIDFENFKQFIADKQQQDSRKSLNAENIKLYGDCLIGFSQGEMWANIDCFRKNLYYGGPDPGCPETNNIQAWGLPALDYTKLGECGENGDLSKLGEVGKFLYDKYSTFFKRYDGIRMDAAWQFVTPFIYQAVNGNYEEFKLPEINFTIFNIMKAAAKNTLGDKFDENNPDNIMLELVGISAGKSREMTLNTYPHLYTTAYAEYDETPEKFREKGYKDGKFYVGVGCHDNDSLVNMAKDTHKRKLHISGMKRDYDLDTSKLAFEDEGYQAQSKEQKIQEDFRTAKLAEIYTTSKQFFTLPDMFGMSERVNISGKAHPDNWTVRIPSDYERFYFSQLANGYGLNLPKALANAMEMKNVDNPELINKCNEAAEILRSDGPMTTQDADEAAKKGELKSHFEYQLHGAGK